jgi:hypothetical protein
MYSVFTVYALALALGASGQANPCDTPPTSQIVGVNVPLTLQACHPPDQVIVGYDVIVDGGPTQIFSAVRGDVSSVSGLRAYVVHLAFGVAAGSHTAILKAWDFKPDANGNPTTEKRYSGETTVAFTAVMTPPPPPPPSYSVTVSKTSAAPGETLTVSFTCQGSTNGVSACKALDWIGLYAVSAGNGGYNTAGELFPPPDLDWIYTRAAASGSFPLKAPAASGTYDLRYLVNDTFTSVAKSQALTVAPVDPCVADPLKFNSYDFPPNAQRNPNWNLNKPADVTFKSSASPWTLTATDARGCKVVVSR